MFEGDDFTYTNPLDAMPIATNGGNRYAPPDRLAELELEVKSMKESETNPRPEEEVADWFDTAPCSMEPQEETIHHKMYEIATSKYNPFSVGGSESIHDFEGGSENLVDR